MSVDQQPAPPDLVAAVDLGSNSFHLAIARFVDGELVFVDRLRERVQLAAGLGPDKRLSDEAQARALACLARFGERLRDAPTAAVRVVGTDTLRVAKNARGFIRAGGAALGHPIEVISGPEEARLIYRGVIHDLPHQDGRRQLVIDIGGGSTECVLGVGESHEHAASLHLGCVTFSRRFFPDGVITRERLKKATIAARLELERLRGSFFRGNWDRVVGASGTISACQSVLRENGWAESDITAKGLKRLRAALVEAGHIDKLALPGLKPTRAPVIAGGVAILSAIFKALPIERMQAATGALREGVLYDLIGRFAQRDVRDTTINNLMERFRVDTSQASRVAGTAICCLDMTSAWLPPRALRRARLYLDWAARLHEVGMSIAFHSYHAHGAYVVANSTMPGFSRDDQLALATLVRAQRRKLTKIPFDELPGHLAGLTKKLAVLLRLAVRLNRYRAWKSVPKFELALTGEGSLRLTFPEGFLEDHPLTRADFEEEAAQLAAAGFTLEVS